MTPHHHISVPHIAEHLEQRQRAIETRPSQPLITPEVQVPRLELPQGPLQTRPLEAKDYLNADNGAIIESWVCGKCFIKEEGDTPPFYFSVVSLLYTAERGRVFGIVREGADAAALMTEGELKDLLQVCVEAF
jgi:hypothetical protein